MKDHVPEDSITHCTDVHNEHPRIKLYGSCFGHQMICQSLFRERGAFVEKSPHGWELGVATVRLNDEFATIFEPMVPLKSMRLQSLHGDHVVFPLDAAPEDLIFVGKTDLCHNQGVYLRNRLFTLQGHPEFDMWIEKVCLELVSKRVGWKDDFTAAAIMAADARDDAQLAAELIMTFFLQ